MQTKWPVLSFWLGKMEITRRVGAVMYHEVVKCIACSDSSLCIGYFKLPI